MTQSALTRPAMMPLDTPDYMAPAWAGCMSWAIGEPKIVAAFEDATGAQYTKLRCEDDVAKGAYVRAFIEWANVNVWGKVDGP